MTHPSHEVARRGVRQGRVAAARERARVRRHFEGAERLVQGRRVALEPSAALNRLLLLDELTRYRRAGRFPREPERRPGSRPQFIDARGTRCAVAHLLEISGQGELVSHIANTRNWARVSELARLPELRAWLSAAGLSLEEAERVQPSYCYYVQAQACFCDDGGRSVVVVGTVVGLETGSVQIRVERIEGDLPGVSVGDQRSVAIEGSSVAIGARLLASPARFDPEDVFVGEPYGLVRVGERLSLPDETVTCAFDATTAKRSVSLDTVIEALMAEQCVDVLASDDSKWNQRTCDGGDVPPSDEGCALMSTGSSGLLGVDLTSAALLGALLLYRRRRRQRAANAR